MIAVTCPDEGTLRAFLDREDTDHEAHAAHVRSCLDCRRTVRELRLAADTTDQALSLLEPVPQEARVAGGVSEPIDPPVRRRRWGRLATAAAATVVAVGLVVTPAGQAAAGGLLDLFHSRSVTPVSITGSDAMQITGMLSMLGSIDGTPGVEFIGENSVADAQAKVPFTVATVPTSLLPAGVSEKPRVAYMEKSTVTVTFSASQTRDYLDSRKASVQVPKGFDGEKLVLHFPDAVALTYGAEDKQLVVVSAGALEATTEGALDLNQLRDFLIKIPSIPTSLTNQLGSVDLAAGILPLPIPVDQMQGTKTTVNGHPAVLVVSSGLGSSVVWQEGNRLTGVLGPYSSDVTLKIAKGLKG